MNCWQCNFSRNKCWICDYEGGSCDMCEAERALFICYEQLPMELFSLILNYYIQWPFPGRIWPESAFLRRSLQMFEWTEDSGFRPISKAKSLFIRDVIKVDIHCYENEFDDRIILDRRRRRLKFNLKRNLFKAFS